MDWRRSRETLLGVDGATAESRWAVWGKFKDADENWVWMSIAVSIGAGSSRFRSLIRSLLMPGG